MKFDWGTGSPDPSIPADYFSARWEGTVVPRYSDTYTFYTQADDGVRLWVNGQLLIDDWNYHPTQEHSGTIALTAGQSYAIRLEYVEATVTANVALLWSSASQAKEVIPSSQLFQPTNSGEYRPNALNQYTTVNGQALTYDGNFNITSYDGATFTYDAMNHLVSARKGTHTASFVYDGLGRRVKQVLDGQTTIVSYEGWKPIHEWDGNGNAQAWNIYGAGPDEILWRWSGASGYLRYHTDMHGNVTALLDWNGYGIEKYTYDAFGKATITDWSGNVRSQSAYGNRFLFQGREYFADFGIYDYRNRFYVPELGRFLQADPLGFGGGDANLFRYCGGDPVNGSDPFGLWTFQIGFAITGQWTVLSGSWNIGVAFDGHGNVAFFNTVFGGGGAGADAGAGVTLALSDAPTVEGLAKGFGVVQGDVGAGPNVSGQGFWREPDLNGKRVIGGGVTLGAGAGVGGGGGGSYTWLTPINYTEGGTVHTSSSSSESGSSMYQDADGTWVYPKVTVTGTFSYGDPRSFGYIGTGIVGGMYAYPGATHIAGSTMQPTGIAPTLGQLNGDLLGSWGSNVPAAAEDGVHWSMTFGGFR